MVSRVRFNPCLHREPAYAKFLFYFFKNCSFLIFSFTPATLPGVPASSFVFTTTIETSATTATILVWRHQCCDHQGQVTTTKQKSRHPCHHPCFLSCVVTHPASPLMATTSLRFVSSSFFWIYNFHLMLMILYLQAVITTTLTSKGTPLVNSNISWGLSPTMESLSLKGSMYWIF